MKQESNRIRLGSPVPLFVLFFNLITYKFYEKKINSKNKIYYGKKMVHRVVYKIIDD